MHKKDDIKKLVKQIEDTRIMMHNLVCEKKYDLLDLEVIKLSQKLDKFLSSYYSLKK